MGESDECWLVPMERKLLESLVAGRQESFGPCPDSITKFMFINFACPFIFCCSHAESDSPRGGGRSTYVVVVHELVVALVVPTLWPSWHPI